MKSIEVEEQVNKFCNYCMWQGYVEEDEITCPNCGRYLEVIKED
jgi:hypothetical protein